MKDYSNFFYNFSKKMSREFNKDLFEIKKMPNKAFKFTCHLGYEYEILIKDIQLLNYPIMIEDIYINYLDKRIPCFISGIRYSMYLLHNGCGTSKENLFSSFSNLCIDLNRHFEYLFGFNYFDPNFIRGIGKEKER